MAPGKPATKSWWRNIAISRIIWPFLLDEVVYIVLPIFVILGVSFHTGDLGTEFLTVKEWSFANVLLFGGAIRRMFVLKSMQSSLRKYESVLPLQILVSMLVASGLVLSLVILAEPHTENVAINASFVGVAQVIIFAIGLISVFCTYVLEDLRHKFLRTPPGSDDLRKYFLLVKSDLDGVENRIEDLGEIIRRLPLKAVQEADPYAQVDHIDGLVHSFQRIASHANRATSFLQHLKQDVQEDSKL